MRRTLPQRRPAETTSLRFGNHSLTITIGHLSDGTPAERELMLASLRVLASQYRLFGQQVESIAIALQTGKATPATAREWLEELGLWEAIPMLAILDNGEAI